MSGDVTINERDFGRLEGKVDGIAQNVSLMREDIQGLGGRVSKLEQFKASIVTQRQVKLEATQEGGQEKEVVQLSRQTVIMLVALLVTVVGVATGILVYMH